MYSNGAFDYLLKSVDDTALENCLNKFLQRKRNEDKDALMTGTDIVTQFIRNCIRDEKYSNFVGENVFRRIFRSWQITVISFRDRYPERDFSIPGLPEGHGNCHCADEAESIENLKQAVCIYINALMKIDKWIGGKNHEENKNKQ